MKSATKTYIKYRSKVEKNLRLILVSFTLLGFAGNANATLVTLSLDDVGNMGTPIGEFSDFTAGELFSATFEIDDTTPDYLTAYSNIGGYLGGTFTITGNDSGASVTLAPGTTRLLAQDLAPTLNRLIAYALNQPIRWLQERRNLQGAVWD